MSDYSFINSDFWFEQKPEDKQTIVDTAFTKEIDNKEFRAYSAEDQQVIRDTYNKKAYSAEYNSPFNPNNKAAAKGQAKMDSGSWAGNASRILKAAVARSADQLATSDDDVIGSGAMDADAGIDFARRTQARRERGTTPGEKQLAFDIAEHMANWETATSNWKKAKLWGNLGLDLIKNPKGVLDTALDSSDSIAKMAAGGWVGAQGGAAITALTGGMGAAAIPISTAVGALAAGFEGELTPYFQAAAEKKLIEAGLPPTAQNYNKLFKDMTWVQQTRKEASLKAAGTSLIDVVTGGILAKFVTLPTRVARRAALKSMTKVQREGIEALAKQSKISVEKITANHVDAVAKDLLKKNSLRSQTGMKALHITGETISEPLSEAGGTMLAGQEPQMEDLIYETVGSFGSGPVQAAIGTSLFGTKLAKGGVVRGAKTTKEILTPKSKELKEAKAINKAETTHRFKQKIKDAAESGDITPFTEPDKLSPLHAVAALRSINQKNDLSSVAKEENIDKAFEVYTNYQTKGEELQARITELTNKPQADLSKEERRELSDTVKLEKEYQVTFAKMDRTIQAMREQNTPTETKDIDLVESIKSGNEDQIKSDIVRSFGSKSNSGDTTKMAGTAQTLKKQKGLGDKVIKFIDNIIGLSKAKSAYEIQRDSTPKSAKDVQQDIYSGTGAFKGINTHLAAIASALSQGNLIAAKAQLAGLKSFSTKHRAKAVKVRKALEAGDPNQRDWFAPLVETEASNLEQAVKLAEEMVGTPIITKQVDTGASEARTEVKKEKPSPSTPETKKPSKAVKTPDLSVRQILIQKILDSDISDQAKFDAIKKEKFKKNEYTDSQFKSVKALRDTVHKKEKPVEETKVEEKGETKEEAPKKEAVEEVLEVKPGPTITEQTQEASSGADTEVSEESMVEVTQWRDGVKTEPKMVPVEQAVKDIEKEIALYEEIRKCVKGS